VVLLSILVMMSRQDQGRYREDAERKEADAELPDSKTGNSAPANQRHAGIVCRLYRPVKQCKTRL